LPDPKETLPLAVEIADLVADAGEKNELLDIKREAKRLVHEHPEAELPDKVVAEVLEEEAKAASDGVPHSGSPAGQRTRRVSMNQVPSEKLTVRSGDNSKWWISSAGPPDGPYVDEQSAIDAAIDRAKALAEAGHASTVVTQRGAEWAEIWPPR
jgi:hypothetical protein